MRIHEFQCAVEVRNPLYLGEVLTEPRWDTLYTSSAEVYLLVDGAEERVTQALFEKNGKWVVRWNPADWARKKAIHAALQYLTKEYPRGVPKSEESGAAA